MPSSVFGPEVQAVFDGVKTTLSRQIQVGGETRTIPTPFPSPQDWRDHWIYFLMIDRFNNPIDKPASTRQTPAVGFDQPFGEFQGGTFNGVMQQLDYIRQLGAGAIWLTPVLKNCQYEKRHFPRVWHSGLLACRTSSCFRPAQCAAQPRAIRR
jgi:hypothetical protein